LRYSYSALHFLNSDQRFRRNSESRGPAKYFRSAVQIDASAFDGLLRFDVARGLYPRKQTRYAAYLQTRF
jgi:hypothetical protein